MRGDIMDIVNLEEKKNKLLNRYRNLFIQRTGFTGNMLNSYVTNLIAIGEKKYGTNFTEDILKEKREDSILWLIDEVSKHGGVISTSSNMVKDTLQETADAYEALSMEKEEQSIESKKDQIFDLVDKMDEYQFEDYLKQLSWPSNVLAKFNGIVSYQISQNPDKSEFEISKGVLKSMSDEIELIAPKKVEEQKDIHVQNTEPIIDSVEQPIINEEPIVENFNNEIDNNQVISEEPTVIPSTARVGKRKEAPKSLVGKFKEKWKNASFKKKLLIGAVAVGAVIGVGIIAATAISQMITTQSFDVNSIMASNDIASNLINNFDTSTLDTNTPVNWSSIGEGTEVHTTLNDALTDTNTLTSNEWMSVDHMEAVNTAGDVVNLDGMTVEQVNQTLDSGDYGVRGSSNGTYMGWFDEGTVKDAINTGKGL